METIGTNNGGILNMSKNFLDCIEKISKKDYVSDSILLSDLEDSVNCLSFNRSFIADKVFDKYELDENIIAFIFKWCEAYSSMNRYWDDRNISSIDRCKVIYQTLSKQCLGVSVSNDFVNSAGKIHPTLMQSISFILFKYMFLCCNSPKITSKEAIPMYIKDLNYVMQNKFNEDWYSVPFI